MAPRVLVVDDEEASRYSMQKALESVGYEVAIACDGVQALELQGTFNPDVVVTDVNMPEMDGITFLQKLQSMPSPPPVIVVTAYNTTAMAVRSLRKGALDYIVKPFDINHLRDAVGRAVERRQLKLDNLRYQSELEEKNRRLEDVEEMLRKHASDLEERVESGARRLVETELRYRTLFNLANDAIFTVSVESGQILDANLRAEVLTGHKCEELRRMKFQDLHPPEERERTANFIQAADESCGYVEDQTFLTKDGRRIILSVSCTSMEMGGQKIMNHICRDVTHIREMEAELIRHTRELEQKFEEKTRLFLESQAQLVQAEKMAALGSLVAGVAHEINTPLGSVNSNNDIFGLAFQRVQQFLEAHPPADGVDPVKELEEVRAIGEDAIRTNRMACERIIKLVRSLRSFARLDEAERKRVSIHECIESTLTLVAHELKRRIEVIKEFGDVREIECYPNQLNQVFMNMLVNASQAIEGEGQIRIRTWEEGDTVRIAMSDTGKGIPPELQAKVFDPGFTTKRAGLGTGLGLSICYRIVENHGGHIELESEVGRGSTFTIVLPIEGVERKPNG